MTVHARLDQPLVLRKDILESAIIISDVIRSFEHLEELRKQRRELKKQLISSVKELNKDMKGLVKTLPQLPKEMRVSVTKRIIRKQLHEDLTNERKDIIKDVEKVKKELKNITPAEAKKMRKKMHVTEERERMKRELGSIRRRIGRLQRLMPDDQELFPS